MKTYRLFSLLVMGFAIMITSCQEQQNPVGIPLSDQSGGGSLAKATVSRTNISIPFDDIVLVPCANGGAGELVHLMGPLHVLFVTTINDNRVTMVGHFQPQGIRGVGLTTGNAYQGTGVERFTFSGSLVNGQFVSTEVVNFRIIGGGNGNNLLLHGTFHVTSNANGEVTAEVDNLSLECR